jgi:raffinose/stachyose/melibiose transport system substrate-binding protein
MRFSGLRRAAVAAVAGAAMVSLALTGCSGGQSASGGKGGGGSATKGTVNWWSWTPDNAVAEREIAAFNKQYPDIKVTYKKVPIDNYAAVLRPALASNSGPDVYSVNAGTGGFSAEAFAPYAYDLTAATKKLLGSDWKSKVFPGGTKAFTIKNRLVAMNWGEVGAGMLWINKDTFDKYKLKAPTTMAEWKTLCATFRSKGLGCFREGLSGTAGFIVDTLHTIADDVQPGWWTGALEGKHKWNEPTMVKSLQIWGEMAHNGILDPGATGILQYPDVNNAFLSGKVPMVQMGTWYSQYATEKGITAALAGAGVPAGTKHITIVPVPFPDVSGGGNPRPLFADPDVGNSVNAKSKNLNAAVTFALWQGATKEGAQAVANEVDEFPNLTGVGPQWDKIKLVNPAVQQPLLEKQTAALSAAKEIRSLGLANEVNQAIIDAAQGLTNGSKTAQAGAAGIQSTADANSK